MQQHHTFNSMAKPGMLGLPLATVASAVLLAVSLPAAAAEPDLESLKREVEAQRVLIDRLLQAQEAQKQDAAKPEAPARASDELLPGVKIFGTADVNVASVDSGFGAKTTVGTAGMGASRIGVRAERVIGDGLKIVGEVEAALAFNQGTVGNAAPAQGINNDAASSGALTGGGVQLFSRQAYVGLASAAYGKLTLGRQYGGTFVSQAVNGYAMGVGLFGNGALLLPSVGGSPTRLNNAIVYQSPLLANSVSASLSYTTGSQHNVDQDTASGTTTVSDKAGAGWEATLFYKQGPLAVSGSTWSLNNNSYVTATETALAKKTGWHLSANYDFKVIKAYFTYITGHIEGGNYENATKTLSNSAGWSLSASVPYGKHKAYVGYTRLNDKSLLNKDANLIGVAYSYDLTANTKFYASWGRLNNKGTSTYSLLDGGDLMNKVTKPGFSPNGSMVGINASF